MPHAIRRSAVLAAATIATLTAGCSAATEPRTDTATPVAAACSGATEKYCAAGTGDLVEVALNEVHPTQPSLGYDEIYYRLGRYTLGTAASDQLFDQWCTTNGQGALKSAGPAASLADPTSFTCEVALGAETDESTAPMKTVVVGPGGRLYLTDGHHTLTSFWEAPGGGPETRIRLKVAGNLAALPPAEFWQQMQDRGWTWLRDADGRPIAPESLPDTLGLARFADDRYRGVLYFVRDIGYAQDDASPAFQEFYWAQWLREQTDPGLQLSAFDLSDMTSYLALVDNIGTAMVALDPAMVIAADRTAQDLGRLNAFGEKAFTALSDPLDSAKPGKLTYAITYKADR